MAGKALKLECYINRAAIGNANANQEALVIWDSFLQMVQDQKGWVTRVANNTGAGPAPNSGRAFWDEPNPALNPFWSYWRWNASARRPHASYFLVAGGLTATLNSGVNAPCRIGGTTNPASVGLGLAWAGKLNASNVAVDPWGGVDPTTKGNPVFSSAGVGEKLYLLPVSNSPAGAQAATRDNMVGAATSFTIDSPWRLQCFADEDNIAFVMSWGSPNTMSLSILLCTVTPAAGVVLDFPVLLCGGYSTAAFNVFPSSTGTIGELDGSISSGSHDGGIVTPTGTAVANAQANYSLLTGAGKQPNSNVSPDSSYDSMEVVAMVNVGGRIGQIDRAFVEMVGTNLEWGRVLDNGNRCVMDGTTSGRARAMWPWGGGVVPGSGSDRNGTVVVT